MDGSLVYGDNMYVDDHYMDEEWKPIRGFDDYMISNKARVWSIKSQKFIKVKPMDNHGHLGVCLTQNGERYYRYIHRLVAEAFIPNPNSYPVVRHMNDNPSFNEDTDLKWGTQKDNIHDAIINGRAHRITQEERRKGNISRMTPVIATHIITNNQLCFESQGEASRLLNIPQGNIWKVIHRERRSAGGYDFKEVCRHAYH